MPPMNGGGISEEMRQCIEECSNCHKTCSETLIYCIQQGGHHSEPEHLRILIDCAEICQTSCNFMLRGSDLHRATCRACAETCERCAADCARMADDRIMKRCADVCRSCARSCQKMSGAAA